MKLRLRLFSFAHAAYEQSAMVIAHSDSDSYVTSHGKRMSGWLGRGKWVGGGA